jgi:hypothetical protein
LNVHDITISDPGGPHHMKTLLRAAAIAVASTALVAGGAATTGASAAPGDSAAVTIQPVTLGTSKFSTSTSVPVSVVPSRANLSSIVATVTVNGVPKADVSLSRFSTSFSYQQAWGAGVVALTNFRETNGQGVAGASNPVNFRYGVNSSDGAHIRKVGKKLTFKIKVRYIGANSKPVGIRKVTLQEKRGSKWRTVKKINLKKNGTKTFKTSNKKKRNYRLVVKDTSLYQGTIFQTRGKI